MVLIETLAKPLFQQYDVSDVPLSMAAGALKAYMDGNNKAVEADKDALEFYFLNHALGWLRANKHPQIEYTKKEQAFVDRYLVLVSDITARAYNYLFIICTREARHSSSALKGGGNIWEYLAKTYGPDVGIFMQELSNKDGLTSVSHLTNTKSKIPLGVYVNALSDIFYKGNWGSSYGGPAWGAVTDCLKDFVHGVISPEMMTDTVWTLAHNNGPIFNKGYMYTGYSGELLSILDVQRSGQVPQLMWDYKFGETYINSQMSSVSKLYTEVTGLLGHPDELIGNIDWWKVEMLGAVSTYSSHKSKQQSKYGDSIYSKKADLVKKQAEMKALTAKKDELTKWFEVAPGIKLKKLKRSELHV